MSPRKLVVVALAIAPMLTGCIVAERPGYYPRREHYFERPTHGAYYRASLEPTPTTVVHVDG